MSKITLIYEDDTQKITHEVDGLIDHVAAMQAFINFLRGIEEEEDLV
jgi:hypothetical protein